MILEKPFELDIVSVRLVQSGKLTSKQVINSPESAVALVGERLTGMDREMMCVVNLKASGMPINVSVVGVGTLNEMMTSPREILKASILSNAASIIMIHNHPSGNLEPSIEDTTLTSRMIKLCELVRIPLLDHVIIGRDTERLFSFKERGILDSLLYKARDPFEIDYHKLEFPGQEQSPRKRAKKREDRER